jgi:hypothetical protein
MNRSLPLIVALAALSGAFAESPSAAPTALPGKGLAGHDFFYAGEAKDRQAFLVKNGKVAWSYEDPKGRGEISDATRLSNGNMLLALQFAVELISPEKKVLWRYDAPAGNEIHTAVPIGHERVLFIQNGDPALVKVVNIVTGKTEKEFRLPVHEPGNLHGRFRHARLTPAGTLLVAHMDMDKVSEYDSDGKELHSFPTNKPWGATPLKNGNILIAGEPGIREITPQGDVVWTLGKDDLPGYTISNFQLAWRLPNGNTLFNNWVNQWEGAVNPDDLPVQALEVTPDKKVVWALRSWSNPNLGPATTVQILGEPADPPENVRFGEFK